MKLRYLLALLVLAEPAALAESAWPSYRHDNARSGHSPAALTLPLKLLWQVQNPVPKPAWPPPAKEDFWNKKLPI
jgi:hypothetical protein